MSEPYRFFEHTADIGVQIFGDTVAELFVNAAGALYEAMGEFVVGEQLPQKQLVLRADSYEDLLHDWISELLYTAETKHAFYNRITITNLTANQLEANLNGGVIDFSRSKTNEEVKAVTYHELHVEQTPEGRWSATVIFDV